MSHNTHKGFLGRIVQRSIMQSGLASGDAMKVVPRFAPAQQSVNQFSSDKGVASHAPAFELNSDIDSGVPSETIAHEQNEPFAAEKLTEESKPVEPSSQSESVAELAVQNQQFDTQPDQPSLKFADQVVEASHDNDTSEQSKKSIDLTVIEEVKQNSFSSAGDSVLHKGNEKEQGQDKGRFEYTLPDQSSESKKAESTYQSTPDRHNLDISHSSNKSQKSSRDALNRFNDIEPATAETGKVDVSNSFSNPLKKTGSRNNQATNVNDAGRSFADVSTQITNQPVQPPAMIPDSSVRPSTQIQNLSAKEEVSEPAQAIPFKPELKKSHTEKVADSDENNQAANISEQALSDRNVMPFSDSDDENNSHSPLQSQAQKIQNQQGVRNQNLRNQGEPAPVVNVRIGKVVVKAAEAQEAVHQPRRVVKSRRPGISLDDYLKE